MNSYRFSNLSGDLIGSNINIDLNNGDTLRLSNISGGHAIEIKDSNDQILINEENTILEYTFLEEGIYTYYCSAGHINMNGTINVNESDVTITSNINLIEKLIYTSNLVYNYYVYTDHYVSNITSNFVLTADTVTNENTLVTSNYINGQIVYTSNITYITDFITYNEIEYSISIENNNYLFSNLKTGLIDNNITINLGDILILNNNNDFIGIKDSLNNDIITTSNLNIRVELTEQGNYTYYSKTNNLIEGTINVNSENTILDLSYTSNLEIIKELDYLYITTSSNEIIYESNLVYDYTSNTVLKPIRFPEIIDTNITSNVINGEIVYTCNITYITNWTFDNTSDIEYTSNEELIVSINKKIFEYSILIENNNYLFSNLNTGIIDSNITINLGDTIILNNNNDFIGIKDSLNNDIITTSNLNINIELTELGNYKYYSKSSNLIEGNIIVNNEDIIYTSNSVIESNITYENKILYTSELIITSNIRYYSNIIYETNIYETVDTYEIVDTYEEINYNIGGGAGGLIFLESVFLGIDNYIIKVGKGGKGTDNINNIGENGKNSLFSYLKTEAIGGGAGGTNLIMGQNGGSGGGSIKGRTGGLGTVSDIINKDDDILINQYYQGYNGIQSGGGANGDGTSNINNGKYKGNDINFFDNFNIDKLNNLIKNNELYFASGGNIKGLDGLDNSGNGGNGNFENNKSGDGGSGLVLLRKINNSDFKIYIPITTVIPSSLNSSTVKNTIFVDGKYITKIEENILLFRFDNLNKNEFGQTEYSINFNDLIEIDILLIGGGGSGGKGLINTEEYGGGGPMIYMIFDCRNLFFLHHLVFCSQTWKW